MSLHPKPELIETDLEHELILLDPVTQEMYSLNRVGRFVWRMLPGRTPEEVAARMVERFEVSPEQAEADVRRIAAELQAEGLLLSSDSRG